MILVETSVWIDFFSSSPGRAAAELRRFIEEAEPFALAGLVPSSRECSNSVGQLIFGSMSRILSLGKLRHHARRVFPAMTRFAATHCARPPPSNPHLAGTASSTTAGTPEGITATTTAALIAAIEAGVFKANCLAVMDEVAAKHESVIITKLASQ